ncbi:hypothetical protein FRB90_000944 [Tulasnella sp. 427]|nr:hypothetical protein FRB90_000944 [Tulasnella sp. 427]
MLARLKIAQGYKRQRPEPPSTSPTPARQCSRVVIVACIVLFFMIFTLATAFAWRTSAPTPPPPPLRLITGLCSEHLERSLDLGHSLLNFSRTFGFADSRRIVDVAALEQRVMTLSKAASGALLATEQTLKEIRDQEFFPGLYASVNIKIIGKLIGKILNAVEAFHEDTSIMDPPALLSFERRVNSIFTSSIPFELSLIEELLTKSSEHCEIIQHMSNKAMPLLSTLKGSLGLIRPWFFVTAWSWERNLDAQERLRVYTSVE